MKKYIYISLCAFMGATIGIIIHGLVEKFIIVESLKGGSIPYNYEFLGKNCYLSPSFSIGFLIGGLIFGIILGIRWWDIVYVKKKRHFKLSRGK